MLRWSFTLQTSAFIRVLFSLGIPVVLAGCATESGSSQGIPNPFAGSARFEPKTTGSIGQQTSQGNTSGDVLPVEPLASKSAISSEPLSAPVLSSPLNQPVSQVQNQATVVAAVQPQKSVAATAVSNSQNPVPSNASGVWSAEGGSQVVLANGETIKSLSDRYGVPESAIRAVNKLSAKAAPPSGTRLIIPVYRDGQSTLSGEKSVKAEASTAFLPKVADSKKVTEKSEKLSQPTATAKVESNVATDAAQASTETTTPSTSSTGVSTAPKPTLEAVGFRWPAKGRVIAGFGTSNGVKNTGIKIALPIGTSVKASEAGTVAYSGSEVKGYGNMVIVRHADGWVSVYANNGELKVKRGDQVSRGQVIAVSGQSGDVSSPQLHFELRKGSAPVDPMPYFSEN